MLQACAPAIIQSAQTGLRGVAHNYVRVPTRVAAWTVPFGQQRFLKLLAVTNG